ncbi:MAG: hypothetical protein CO099_06265 [Bdellovibrio sp. CG_4_9_14_3_um_filter_39_7]|nr:MAG: hypothetical protein CO099_06265 [Bdellovibrio sp. CG_4_9_14_3_um_filter_39_7]
MSKEIEVVFNQDLKAYPNGFTLCHFKKGQRVSLPFDFAMAQLEAGICSKFENRETKPFVEPIEIKKTGLSEKALSKKGKAK